ncbi:short-chain dehydrogenase [Armillaria novae-zelandiae]|uniref:Short-chain dehydrogenase n=1 Tax=Armillaria novae-zelandiae TaxID=153914 RepID=A0AA39U0T8_9AGAR|nr:short-chain dehydrogenase [Armillaria novae-zelandiae]
MADLNIATTMSLSGRIGLVTGGGTGIGFMIAKAFASKGAKVYITGRRLDVLEKAAATVTGVSGSIVPLRMDVTNEEDVKAGAKHIEGIDGKLDVLVNNAGYAGARNQSGTNDQDFTAKKYAAEDPFEPETVPNWADIFTLNTITPFFVVRAFQSLLVKGASSRPQGTSSVINISSIAAKLNISAPMVSVCILSFVRSLRSLGSNKLAYSVTKAALDKLTLVLATSFAGKGIPIRVNALQPGVFASEIMTPELLEVLKTQLLPGQVAPIPAKRPGSEAEMGMTALYLAVSDYTNGAVLCVDGGFSLVNP